MSRERGHFPVVKSRLRALIPSTMILETELPLAWLRAPFADTSIRVLGRGVEAQAGQISFYAPDFALASSQPWLNGTRAPLSLQPQALPKLIHRVGPPSADFALMHEEILSRIGNGEFEKVVPIVCEELEFQSPLHASMFTDATAEADPNQFSYGFEFEGEGLCGVTPELLFSVGGGILQTMALAGTGAVGGPPLLDDRKERHEHQLVIDHIALELRYWGVPEIGKTEERIYGSLKHLFTPIQMKLERLPNFLDLVVRLHPTAALGGWPRRPAVEWLEKQKFHLRRKRFGAPFGFVNGEQMFCVVAIRCIQWEGARALLSAGCGVVTESEPLSEWNELQLKRRATCRLLGLEL